MNAPTSIPKPKGARLGFTLPEVLATVAIIAVIAGLVIVAAPGSSKAASVSVAQAQAASMSRALMAWVGTSPGSVQELRSQWEGMKNNPQTLAEALDPWMDPAFVHDIRHNSDPNHVMSLASQQAGYYFLLSWPEGEYSPPQASLFRLPAEVATPSP